MPWQDKLCLSSEGFTMNKITAEDLQNALNAYVEELNRSGMLKYPLQLQRGSKTNGNAFRVMFISGEHGGLTPAPGTSDGFIGWTKHEAHDTLWTIIRTLQDVRYFSKES